MYSSSSPSSDQSVVREAKGNRGGGGEKRERRDNRNLASSGRVVLLCEFLSLLTVSNGIPYPDVFSLSPSPCRCVEENRSKRQVVRQKHGSFFLATQRTYPQAMLSETTKEAVQRRRRRVHLATSASVGVILVITEIPNAEF